jgi:hypothetical protein
MANLERPQCEFRGAAPHPASPAYLLVWNLSSGTQARFSCAGHRFSFGGPGYWVNKVEGFEDNKGEHLTTEELVALLDLPVEGRLGNDSDERLATCLNDECINPARLGEFCDECHGAWEEKQRALAAQAAAEGRPRAINKRRGF